MARRHRMTPKRRAALRKAQLASARKRSRGISKKQAAGSILALAGGAAAIYGSHKAYGKVSTVRRKQRAFNELNGRHIKLTITKTKPVSEEYASAGISRPSFGVMQVAHGSRRQGVRISAIGPVRTSTITGTRVAGRVTPRINRDDIPLYNPNNSKSWPGGHGGGVKRTRKRNRKLRRLGMLE